MKLEAGKRYVMRNGGVTGSLSQDVSGVSIFEFYCTECGKYWTKSGSIGGANTPIDSDIVAEYVEPQESNEAPQLTLRDQFAMAALTGFIASADETMKPEAYAIAAYMAADAMMKARKK